MHILNWIWETVILAYGIDIIIVLGLALLCWYWIKRGSKARVFRLAKTAVIMAEQLWQSETGQLKKQEAIEWIHKRSVLARLFLTEDDLEVLVENAVSWLKTELNEKEQEAILNGR